MTLEQFTNLKVQDKFEALRNLLKGETKPSVEDMMKGMGINL